MALRCFLFTSDEGTAALIRQILADLGVEAEPCSDAVAAAEKITNKNFQIVIIDWDKQPEATFLLTTARERKAVERPLTLAIVSDDKSVPGVLQAGANSILRRPIVVNQAKDTLTTASDLLRAKHDSAGGVSHVSAAAASAAPSSLPGSLHQEEKTLRGGEFLVTASPNPGSQYQTESDLPLPSEHASAIPLEPLKDLEPTAASVAQKPQEPSSPAPVENQTRGLEWYLKTRIATRPSSPAPSDPPKPGGNPELLGFDQISSQVTEPVKTTIEPRIPAPMPAPPAPSKSTKKKEEQRKEDQRKEAELFAYMDGERVVPSSPSRFHLGKRAIFAALLLAAIAITAAPQAPWHPKLRALWRQGHQSMRAWLNPQPVTPVQVTVHEDFARPGDEYKLPVAESIPDATTDPSQIEVLPAIDPTAKKPNPDAANPAQTAPTDGSTPVNPSEPPPAQTPEVQPSQAPMQPVAVVPTPAVVQSPVVVPASLPPHSNTAIPVESSPSHPTPAAAAQPHYASTPGNIPPSLRSQLAPAAPEPSNKPVGSALPSIEPVTVSEAAERALLTTQPAITYPANAKEQQGTVVLQVLVGRDGTVQDAKFFQGSFLFARAAIDSVKQWKFKPYILNGRPVSVQTTLTMKFKPVQ